jgi:hypothetical protein
MVFNERFEAFGLVAGAAGGHRRKLKIKMQNAKLWSREGGGTHFKIDS